MVQHLQVCFTLIFVRWKCYATFPLLGRYSGPWAAGQEARCPGRFHADAGGQPRSGPAKSNHQQTNLDCIQGMSIIYIKNASKILYALSSFYEWL